MKRIAVALAFGCSAWLAGCATTPIPPETMPPEDDEPLMVETTPPSVPFVPLIEYPPIEPVEPPLPEPPPAAPQPAPPPAPAPAPLTPPAVKPPATIPAPQPAPGPAPAPAPAVPPAAPAPELPSDEQVTAGLVSELARYGTLGSDELRREITGATQALGRSRTDANRVRLAMLYTLARTTQDDLRALQLLENVAKSNPGSPGVKQLAGVLQIQVIERLRAVREEQQKAETAIQKLEALRAMERGLLRDRLRSGGGGGAGGGSGGGSGAGGR